MLTHDEARTLFAEKVDEYQTLTGIEVVILDELTIERERGWVFRYQSKKYAETGDMNDMLFGSSGTFVNRHDGSMHETGSGQSLDHYIEEYENQLR